ncbi:MAG: sodium:proton antiporter NhaD [Chlamydiales bacterium]|nr:sodium:proton antiporter NhaD [Chlamydiales bacterium]
MIEHMSIYSNWIIAIFTLGYLMIIFEHQIGINKATSALLMAVGCWSLQFADVSLLSENTRHLSENLASVSQVVLFLLGAVTIVETINAHGGFSIIANFVRVSSKKLCLCLVALLSFFLSAVLDNLTTTIVMVILLRRIITHTQDRIIFGSAVVIAANAGGAWTPIGDVTTTMLWLGGQVTTMPLLQKLFLPSFTCLVVSVAALCVSVRGKIQNSVIEKTVVEHKGELVLVCGILSLIFVPIFKMLTGLPPFMGILCSMSFMWLLTDFIHKPEERMHLRVTSIFPKVDLSSIFFFLGILLSVGALETAGILKELAIWLDGQVPSKVAVASIIGVASAVIDNVPLVAATMGMYDLATYAPDHPFWLLIAFCAGTGGSMLIIGSAAGVAFMSLEKVDFFTDVKKAALPALLGYIAGISAYLFFS